MLRSVMMPLFDGPIDTANYMILGFAVIFGVLFLHLWSLRARWQNLRRDLELLEEIEKDK